MTALVARTDRDGVARLMLDRPERRNAFTTEMLAELRDHLNAIAADPECRAVVLTGAGGTFCAGADVREFGDDPSPELRESRLRLVGEVLCGLGELEQPTLAAVNGPAVGGGWGLALACDLSFAVREASFSLPEVAKGFRLPEPLMRRLVQVVGPVRAAELAFAGTTYTAEEAMAAGCVTRVLATRDELLTEAERLCESLASRSSTSIATAKEPLRAIAAQSPLHRPETTWTEDSP